MKQATLCLLIKEDKILLAMKKRGFGVGKWNGVGGKLEQGETDRDAVIRETKEEIGVEISNPEKVGLFHFLFPYKPEWNQDVSLFLAKEWKGNPQESEEVRPEWFLNSQIPYDKMWDADKLWLPSILAGNKLEANFVFKEGEITEKHEIKIIKG